MNGADALPAKRSIVKLSVLLPESFGGAIRLPAKAVRCLAPSAPGLPGFSRGPIHVQFCGEAVLRPIRDPGRFGGMR